MYLEYYRLKKHPFKITCDPAFLWFSEKHKEALANLRYGLTGNQGFVLLTGEVGTGKTLLVNKLLTMVPENTIAVSLSGHNVNIADFYRLLADRMRLPYTFIDKSEFLLEFEKFVRTANADGRRFVLIIDEAQVFGQQVIEDIRMLSNIELPDKKLLSVFLVGQPELNTTLLKPENMALAQRITARYHLSPLNEGETATYIDHRLRVAGSSSEIFSESAVRRIFDYTGGTPRLINVLCDRAMLTGSVYNLNVIEADTISECATELSIPDLNAEPVLPQPRLRRGLSNAVNHPLNAVANLKEKEPYAFQRPFRHLIKLRLSRLIYAGIVPAFLFCLTLAFMTVDKNPSEPDHEVEVHAMQTTSPPSITRSGNPPPDEIEWSDEKEIHVYFSQSNEIDPNCIQTINQVAEQLKQFPEQAVFVHLYADGAVPSKQLGAIWQKRVEALRSHLIRQGVYAYQIKEMVSKTQAEPPLPDGRILQPVLVAYHQGQPPVIYNEDK